MKKHLPPALQPKRLQQIMIPTVCALVGTLVLFMLFLWMQDKSATQAIALIYKGGFSSGFAWQNTLQRAAPLMLAALCVALPAQVGLVIIGGEGAIALGGLAAAMLSTFAHSWWPQTPAWLVLTAMAVAAITIGGLWIGLAGALLQHRGVNETIGSLLLSYIAIALFKHLIEGPMRDPASQNVPSTVALPPEYLLGSIPALGVHWGLAWAVIACVILFIVIKFSVLGFALTVVGGNARAARFVGLPVAGLVITACLVGGAMAGLAGMLEVAAVHGTANSALLAGYGFSGILVAFAARHNPLAIIVCAILIGGIQASSGLLQRRLDLPDATTLVLQGLLFANLLLCETFNGRLQPLHLRIRSLLTIGRRKQGEASNVQL